MDKKYKTICFIISAILIFTLTGCSVIPSKLEAETKHDILSSETTQDTMVKEDDNNSAITKYQVIKSLEKNGMTYFFDYSADGNKITLTTNFSDISYIIFVNSSGVVTSIYVFEAGKQYTYFKINNDEVEYNTNDVGYLDFVKYEPDYNASKDCDYIELKFQYDNIIDNNLIAIDYEYRPRHAYSEEDFDIHTYTSDNRHCDDVTDIIYSTNSHSSYQLFGNILWIFSMFDILEQVNCH